MRYRLTIEVESGNPNMEEYLEYSADELITDLMDTHPHLELKVLSNTVETIEEETK